MKISYVVAGVLALIAVIAAADFLWPILESLSAQGGLGVVLTMIVVCFAVGGGLTFLLVYSGRRGYDARASQTGRTDGDHAAPPNVK